MIVTWLNNAATYVARAIRSRSNLRPTALFCLGAAIVIFGMALGMAGLPPPSFAILLIVMGVVLSALAVAGVMLRPDAANDN